MRYLIAGIGNIGKKRALALGKKFVVSYDPNPKANADFKYLKKIPSEIYDAAVLTVPQQYKFDLTKHFLSLGKHVLNEKPFIVTKKQLNNLKKVAKEKNVIFYTSYNHRFEPNIQKLSKIVKSGLFEKFYFGRMIYSFGNIRERIGTWRESEFGVLEEIAPHLIDICMDLFNYKGKNFKHLISRKVESKIFDHWVLGTTDQKIIIETSSLSWKNLFSIDLYFDKGSLHINGLRKWGGSEFIQRLRILPSGIPKERKYFDSGEDLTWQKDFAFFEKISKEKKLSYESDLQMSKALAIIALGSKNPNKNDQYKLYKQIIKK